LARMAADGLITLPAPRTRQGRPRRHLEATIEAGPEISCSLHHLSDIHTNTVTGAQRAASATWNEMIGRFHYLGYTPASGTQIRWNKIVIYTGVGGFYEVTDEPALSVV